MEKPCDFCHSSNIDELNLGKTYSHKGINTHYFCLLLSSKCVSKGKDHEGICGFLKPEITNELRRGKKQTCCYCKQKGATIGCCTIKCRKTFHLPCGIKNKSISQFFGLFESFCSEHTPVQTYTNEHKLYAEQTLQHEDKCGICFDNVLPSVNRNSIWAPCCRNGWFHRNCVAKLAQTAGYYFIKCPLCNDVKRFKDEILRIGIYIPQQDAEWELEPHAYQDLLYRYGQCDIIPCLCIQGNMYNMPQTKWEIRICETCGSAGAHIACRDLSLVNPKYICDICNMSTSSILTKIDKHTLPKGKSKRLLPSPEVPVTKIQKQEICQNGTGSSNQSNLHSTDTGTKDKSKSLTDNQSQFIMPDIPSTSKEKSLVVVSVSQLDVSESKKNAETSASNDPSKLQFDGCPGKNNVEFNPMASSSVIENMIDLGVTNHSKDKTNQPLKSLGTHISNKLSHINSPMNKYLIKSKRFSKQAAVFQCTNDNIVPNNETTNGISTTSPNEKLISLNDNKISKISVNKKKFISSRNLKPKDLINTNVAKVMASTVNGFTDMTPNNSRILRNGKSSPSIITDQENKHKTNNKHKFKMSNTQKPYFDQQSIDHTKHFTKSEFWLRKRQIDKTQSTDDENIPEVYRDITRSVLKSEYTMPIWKQNCIRLRNNKEINRVPTDVPIDKTEENNTGVLKDLTEPTTSNVQQSNRMLASNPKITKAEAERLKNLKMAHNELKRKFNLAEKQLEESEAEYAKAYETRTRATENYIKTKQELSNIAKELNQTFMIYESRTKTN